jgi:hypothetical protein
VILSHRSTRRANPARERKRNGQRRDQPQLRPRLNPQHSRLPCSGYTGHADGPVASRHYGPPSYAYHVAKAPRIRTSTQNRQIGAPPRSRESTKPFYVAVAARPRPPRTRTPLCDPGTHAPLRADYGSRGPGTTLTPHASTAAVAFHAKHESADSCRFCPKHCCFAWKAAATPASARSCFQANAKKRGVLPSSLRRQMATYGCPAQCRALADVLEIRGRRSS